MRKRVAWPLTIAVLVLGETLGHSLAYRIVAPNAHERAVLLARTGHAYLEHLHSAIALCVVFAAACLVRQVASAARGMPPRRIPGRRFALVPAVAFLAQEYVERLAYHGHVIWTTVAEPAVLVGLVLQVPLGLGALVLIRALLRVADRAGRVLAARRHTPAVTRPKPIEPVADLVARLRPLPLARGVAERAPPLTA